MVSMAMCHVTFIWVPVVALPMSTHSAILILIAEWDFSSISSTYSSGTTYSWSVDGQPEFGHLLGSPYPCLCERNPDNTASFGCYTTEVDVPSPGISIGWNHRIAATNTGIPLQRLRRSQAISSGQSNTAATCLSSIGSPTPSCTDGISEMARKLGCWLCGGPWICPPCPAGCTITLWYFDHLCDNYPSETTWNIKMLQWCYSVLQRTLFCCRRNSHNASLFAQCILYI